MGKNFYNVESTCNINLKTLHPLLFHWITCGRIFTKWLKVSHIPQGTIASKDK